MMDAQSLAKPIIRYDPSCRNLYGNFASWSGLPSIGRQNRSRWQFAYPINTTTEGAIKVVIEGEEGHRASIVANRVSTQASNNSGNALMLVREDISKLKDKIYLHDIIGGIGYIVGIFGLWALVRASKMTRTSQSKER